MKKKFKPKINKGNWLDETSATEAPDVRPYNLKELCTLYQMSYYSFTIALKPLKAQLGRKTGIFFSAKQVEMIFLELGVPYSFK